MKKIILHVFLLSFHFFLLTVSNLQALQVNSLTYSGEFKPGESREVKINLINDRDIPEKIDLRLCDYACNHEGHIFFEEPGKMERTNASWITLNQEYIIMEPKEQRDVSYTIHMPLHPPLNGSYFSALLIEPADPIEQPEQSNTGFTLCVKIRYAHHIVTNIGKGIAKLKILEKKFRSIEDKKYLAIDVMNTGDLFLSPKLTLKLYDDKGSLKKTLEHPFERLYPGNSQRYHVSIEGVEAGKYTSFLLLDNGDNNLFGETFLIEFP